MGPKDIPFGGALGSARQPAPESTTEGNVFELPGLAGGDPAQAAGVMGTMMELLQQKGGLGGLLDSFRASGLGAQADSWASSGPIHRRRVTRSSARQPDIDGLAQKLGISIGKETLSQWCRGRNRMRRKAGDWRAPTRVESVGM